MSKKTKRVQPAKPQVAPTAARRRSTQGLMLLVAVIAAIGITTIANYLVYWQYRGLSPEARSWVRYDLTSTRRYSLSEQSRGVINSLEKPHRIVTMLGGDTLTDEHRQRVRDLADEYGRASTKITVEHIDLDTESNRRAELLSEMDAMFAEDTADIRSAISKGLTFVDRSAQTVDQIEKLIKAIIDSGVELRPASIQKQRLDDLHSQYLRLQEQREELLSLRDQMLGSAWKPRLRKPGQVAQAVAGAGEQMPDYTQLMAMLQRYAIQLTRQTLPDTPGKADQLRRGVVVSSLSRPEAQEAALDAQNTLAALAKQVPEVHKTLSAEADALLGVGPPMRYEQARAILNDKPCVLVTVGGDARVLPAEVLFRGAGNADQGQTSDLFVGEEQLTGALISMRLDPPPLIVFIRSNTGLRAFESFGADQQPKPGIYDYVAKRLLTMDFEVVEWANPLREDPPQPRAGQRVVWVTMPYLKPDPTRKESLDNTRKDKVAKHLEERLAAGDSALVMPSFNPDTDPRLDNSANADSLITLLDQFGIEAQVYHNVSRLRDEADDPADSVYTSAFYIDRWPNSAIVGRALEGINTYFFAPMPLELRMTQGVKQTALAELTMPAMHVQRTVPDRETGAFTPEPDSAKQRVLIGAAAERDQARLIAIGDATWALDNLTSAAVLPDGKSGPGLADEPGAKLLYPGNTDLFVNCICWLAHEDQLIAASPRTQDVRRITELSPASLRLYRIGLLGVMPAAIFLIGIIVWLARRRA